MGQGKLTQRKVRSAMHRYSEKRYSLLTDTKLDEERQFIYKLTVQHIEDVFGFVVLLLGLR